MNQGASDRPRGLTPEEVECLRARVQSELIGRLRDFHLQFLGHGLVLGGRTYTYYGKQLAQHSRLAQRAVELELADHQVGRRPVLERGEEAQGRPGSRQLHRLTPRQRRLAVHAQVEPGLAAPGLPGGRCEPAFSVYRRALWY